MLKGRYFKKVRDPLCGMVHTSSTVIFPSHFSYLCDLDPFICLDILINSPIRVFEGFGLGQVNEHGRRVTMGVMFRGGLNEGGGKSIGNWHIRHPCTIPASREVTQPGLFGVKWGAGTVRLMDHRPAEVNLECGEMWIVGVLKACVKALAEFPCHPPLQGLTCPKLILTSFSSSASASMLPGWC